MRFGSFRAWAAPPLVYRPRLNPLSPLARGVRYVYLPIDGLRATNLVSGGPLTPAGTTSIEVDRGSLAWYSSGGVNGLDSPADVVLSAPMSMGVVFRPTTTIVFSTEDVCSYHRAGSLGSRNAVGLRSYFGSISAYSVNNSGTLVKDDAPGTPLNDRPNAALGVFRSATYRRAWLNGRAGPGNTTSSIPLARETLSLSSGAGTTRSTGHAGRYYLAVVWDRELSEAEALAWTRDPWQMFLASPSVGLWAPGAVGGGGFTGAVAAGTSATVASTPAGTQSHVGAAAAASSATLASAPAGTQVHQGAVAAAVSETASSTPAGTSAYNGAAAAGTSATVASTPAGTQSHVGAAAAASSATLASAPAGTQVHQGAVTEAASAADAVSSVATWVAQALEAASAADVATAATTVLVDIAEAASAADAVSSVATWVAQALEAVSAAETLAAGYSAAASAAVTEAVSAADAVSSVATWVAQALEAASAADVATAATTVLAAMAEVAGPAEALTSTYSAAGAASIDEPAAAADSIVAAATVLAAVLEAGSAAEASTAATTWVALLTESAVPADGVAVPQTWSVSAAELAAAVEALSAAWLGSGGALTAPPIAGRLQVAVRFARQSATRAARAQRDSR